MIELVKLSHDTLQDAYNDGFRSGEQLGFENGEERGYMRGFDVGMEEGYAEGVKVGYADGKTDGYNNGYSAGKTKGKQEEKNEFWNEYLQPDENGLIYGSYLFAGCGFTQAKLEETGSFETRKYSNAYSMFRSNANITNLRKTMRFDLNECTDTDYMFSSCENLKYIYSFRYSDLETYAYRTFRYCHSLIDIDKLYFSENTTAYEECFLECYKLERISAKGTINGTGLHFEDCPLTADSMVSIIACLKKQPSGSTKVITFGATNLAKLTASQKAVATGKGWTLK